MSYELQFDARTFGRVIRNRLRSQMDQCPGQSFDTPLGAIIVDRIEIADDTIIQREKRLEPNGTEVDDETQNVWIFTHQNFSSFKAPYMQVKQRINVFLVRESDLELNGTNATTPILSPQLIVCYNVSASVANQSQGGSSTVTLDYRFAYIDYGPFGSQLPQAQKDQLETMVRKIILPSVPIDMAAIGKVGGASGDARVRNAGITCDPAGTFIALRMEADIVNSPNKLGRPFFTTGTPNHLNGLEWALHVDEDVLVRAATLKATEELNDIPKMKLRRGPWVAWNPAGPGLRITAETELMSACKFFVNDIDMDVDVWTNVNLSLDPARPNNLITTTEFGGDPSNFAEEIACAVTTSLLWPFIMPFVLAENEVDGDEAVGIYIGGLFVTPLARAIGVLFAINSITPDAPTPESANCKKIGDTKIECADPLNLGMELVPGTRSRFRLDQIAGLASGLVVRGGIDNLRDVQPGSITMTNTGFNWVPWGSCRGGFGIFNQAQVEFTTTGTSRDLLCEVKVVSDDPQKAYELIKWENTWNIRSKFRDLANAYGCKLRIVTKRGVRTIVLPAPTAATEEEQQQVQRMVDSLNKDVCQAWKDTFIEQENRNWGLDDPVDEINFMRHWEIVVHELAPNTIIKVQTQEGLSIVDAIASEQGVAHISTMFDGSDAPATLVLVKEGVAQQPAVMTTRQTNFAQSHSFGVEGEVQSLDFSRDAAGARLLTITDTARASTFNVSNARRPVFLGAIAMPSFMGAEDGGKRNTLVAGRLPRIGGKQNLQLDVEGDCNVLRDVSDPAKPQTVATYHGKPWFDGAAASGKLLAKVRPGGGAVDLYLATASGRDADLVGKKA